MQALESKNLVTTSCLQLLCDNIVTEDRSQ